MVMGNASRPTSLQVTVLKTLGFAESLKWIVFSDILDQRFDFFDLGFVEAQPMVIVILPVCGPNEPHRGSSDFTLYKLAGVSVSDGPYQPRRIGGAS
jgi:hypothetical protein